MTLPEVLRLHHGTEEWTADVSVDVSRVPKELRPVLVTVAYSRLYRAVSLMDEPPAMSWQPLTYAVLLLAMTILVSAVFF